MSIIQRENPLNLQYNICIVTAASSPLGVRVCKSLLKANALVLGLDTKTRDATLNAGLGTHFQFEECDIEDQKTAEKVIAAAKDKFGLDRIDAVVNIVDKGKDDSFDGLKRLSDAAIKAMKEQGKGAVVVLSQDLEAEKVPDGLAKFTKDMALKHQDGGIRCNAILPLASGGGDTESAKAFSDAKHHMTELQQSKEEPSKAHEIGLLVGFLVSDLGGSVAGRIVRLDGSSSPL